MRVLKEKRLALYQKHERWIPIWAFVLGFLFDLLTLGRIDEISTIGPQVVYLVLCGGIVWTEFLDATQPRVPPKGLGKIWSHREFILHFSLGALLNGFAIYFFKSASGFASLLFVGGLVAILMVNEFLRVDRLRIQIHVALVCLALLSFSISITPVVMGFVGVAPFILGVLLSMGLWLWFGRLLRPWYPGLGEGFLRKNLVYPVGGVHALWILLYFFNGIPPVPLAAKYMGIYHGVEKRNGQYALTYTRPDWKFWQKGDQTFLARPGDRLVCFAQIFSPARFKDELQVRWSWYGRHGWEPQDAIPLTVSGGRDEGYRVVTIKNNYVPGKWRVQIETTDGREIARLPLEIVADSGTEPREEKVELR